MNRWEHDITHVSKEEIMEYCVQDEDWQDFRVNVLKGEPTHRKLKLLEMWFTMKEDEGVDERRTQVQIDNYINALKRGGQLDLEGNIVR